jgi:hypothetical protein
LRCLTPHERHHAPNRQHRPNVLRM